MGIYPQVNWVFSVFTWVLVKFIVGNTTLSICFLCNFNYFNWVFINFFALWYPLFQNNNWVNTPKSSLSVSLNQGNKSTRVSQKQNSISLVGFIYTCSLVNVIMVPTWWGRFRPWNIVMMWMLKKRCKC